MGAPAGDVVPGVVAPVAVAFGEVVAGHVGPGGSAAAPEVLVDGARAAGEVADHFREPASPLGVEGVDVLYQRDGFAAQAAGDAELRPRHQGPPWQRSGVSMLTALAARARATSAIARAETPERVNGRLAWGCRR